MIKRIAQVTCSFRAKVHSIWWSISWSEASDNAYQLPAANFDTLLKEEVSSFNLKRIRNSYKIEWRADMAGRWAASEIPGTCTNQTTKPARLFLSTRIKTKQKCNFQTRKPVVCRNYSADLCAIVSWSLKWEQAYYKN